jgi:hypothetical protein
MKIRLTVGGAEFITISEQTLRDEYDNDWSRLMTALADPETDEMDKLWTLSAEMDSIISDMATTVNVLVIDDSGNTIIDGDLSG